MVEAQQLFQKTFGQRPARLVRAPGRLELLGNHTDYNEGLVLALAVDKHLHIASSPRSDGRIEIVSSAFPASEKFSFDRLEKNPAAPWADYVKGVLVQLRRRGIHFGGFNAAIHSGVPMGAGLGSSAALLVATALTIRQLHPFRLQGGRPTMPPERDAKGNLPPLNAAEKLELAKLSLAAESEFVGLQCGLLDQISSLFGKAHHALEIDCRENTVRHVPLLGELAIVVCQSGVKHELISGEYNQLRSLCDSAARKLQAKVLRSVEPRYLSANKSRLTEREHQCAYHVVGEIQRVIFGERALRTGDFKQFGQFMFQSHESSREFFLNSCPELDVLVELARAQPGCLGARLTGGGFGGATVNLVQRKHVEAFSSAMAAGYEVKTGRVMTPLRCEIVDGAE